MQLRNRREKLIYLAGLMDGDGCFGVSRYKRIRCAKTNPYVEYEPYFFLNLQMTDKEPVEWAWRNFHGSFNKREFHANSLGNKPMWLWTLSGARAEKLHEELCGFMKLERKRNVRLPSD